MTVTSCGCTEVCQLHGWVDQFQPATRELLVFTKGTKRFFDLDAVRGPFAREYQPETEEHPKRRAKTDGGWSTLPDWDPATSAGAPPLDWWNIPPGGYSGAHYAVFPPELLVKPIKAMCPEKVCRTCGEPQRRVFEHLGEERRAAPPSLAEFSDALTTAMRQRGVNHRELASWLGVAESVIRHYLGKTGAVNHRLPSITAWKALSELLPFDQTIQEAMETVLPDYETADRGNRQVPERLSGGAFDGDLPKVVATGWSDCGHSGWHCVVDETTTPYVPFGESDTERRDHARCGWVDNYRPGLVLDPFAGSGTTLAVATGHGRDAIGIDLDERNYELSLDRVGPLILQRGEIPDGAAPKS